MQPDTSKTFTTIWWSFIEATLHNMMDNARFTQLLPCVDNLMANGQLQGYNYVMRL